MFRFSNAIQKLYYLVWISNCPTNHVTKNGIQNAQIVKILAPILNGVQICEAILYIFGSDFDWPFLSKFGF